MIQIITSNTCIILRNLKYFCILRSVKWHFTMIQTDFCRSLLFLYIRTFITYHISFLTNCLFVSSFHKMTVILTFFLTNWYILYIEYRYLFFVIYAAYKVIFSLSPFPYPLCESDAVSSTAMSGVILPFHLFSQRTSPLSLLASMFPWSSPDSSSPILGYLAHNYWAA